MRAAAPLQLCTTTTLNRMLMTGTLNIFAKMLHLIGEPQDNRCAGYPPTHRRAFRFIFNSKYTSAYEYRF